MKLPVRIELTWNGLQDYLIPHYTDMPLSK